MILSLTDFIQSPLSEIHCSFDSSHNFLLAYIMIVLIELFASYMDRKGLDNKALFIRLFAMYSFLPLYSLAAYFLNKPYNLTLNEGAIFFLRNTLLVVLTSVVYSENKSKFSSYKEVKKNLNRCIATVMRTFIGSAAGLLHGNDLEFPCCIVF